MNDSTPFLDAGGIRRDQPLLPQRHAIAEHALRVLGLLADLGDPESVVRQGWITLLQVHGFDSVLHATARCSQRVAGCGKVTNDQAQAILDGKLPGHAVQRHGTSRRRPPVT